MSSHEEFTGKYEGASAVGGMLINAFFNDVRSLVESTLSRGDTVLEVGCGAGYSTERISAWLPDGVLLIATDVGFSLTMEARKRVPGLPAFVQSAYALALPDKSVDVVVMLEVLEHLEDPRAALRELARVARKRVVISTPREPLWRILNLCRMKYVSDLGNTPGHIQHWSTTSLKRLASQHLRMVAQRTPIPWTILALEP